MIQPVGDTLPDRIKARILAEQPPAEPEPVEVLTEMNARLEQIQASIDALTEALDKPTTQPT